MIAPFGMLLAEAASAISFACPPADVGGSRIELRGLISVQTQSASDRFEVTLDTRKSPAAAGWGRVQSIIPRRQATTPIRFAHHSDTTLLLLEVPGGAASLDGSPPNFKARVFDEPNGNLEGRVVADMQCGLFKARKKK